MSGDGYKPPGLLKRLWLVAGDLVYGVLIAFGWQPREQRDKR